MTLSSGAAVSCSKRGRRHSKPGASQSIGSCHLRWGVEWTGTGSSGERRPRPRARPSNRVQSPSNKRKRSPSRVVLRVTSCRGWRTIPSRPPRSAPLATYGPCTTRTVDRIELRRFVAAREGSARQSWDRHVRPSLSGRRDGRRFQSRWASPPRVGTGGWLVHNAWRGSVMRAARRSLTGTSPKTASTGWPSWSIRTRA
jgi:hypothetical protein